MMGMALLAIGAVLLWAAFTKRGDAILTALQMNLPAAEQNAQPTAASNSGTSGGSKSSSGNDSGSHMGIDASGNVISIGKAYADMTDEEKDAANRFAHSMENLGSSA